jgi:hypothetical protein
MIRFTEKVRTKTMSFVIGENELHTAFCVIVESVDGRKMTVKDDDSPYGVMGADSRNEAIKKGKDFLKRMKERE